MVIFDRCDRLPEGLHGSIHDPHVIAGEALRFQGGASTHHCQMVRSNGALARTCWLLKATRKIHQLLGKGNL